MKSPLSALFKTTLVAVAAMVLVSARPPKVADTPVSDNLYSISSGPGEDASQSMCISWACDLSVGSTCVLLTEASDKKWKKARIVWPEQERRCDVFKGVFSTAADGSDMYEDAVFTKCGATVTGLYPDTDYKYVVVERVGKKYAARSSEHYFRTAGAESWSACIISDFHSYPPIPTRLEAAMGMIDTMQCFDPSLDWIFCPGDVVAWGGSYSFWRRLFEEDNFNEFFWARVNGNHDNWTRESQITHDFNIPNDYFTGTSWYPQNGYEGQMGVCYHFRYGNTLFVMLNTEDMVTPEEFDAAQNWLRNCVNAERAGANPPTFVVVCMHYEWFIGTSGRTSEYRRWHRVFDELGVDLAVAGNNHVYVRTAPLFDDQVTDGTTGTVYLQTSASDNDRGRALSDKPMQNPDKIVYRWTEGTYSVSAIHMDVNAERIALTLLDRHGNAVDSTVIPAKPQVKPAYPLFWTWLDLHPNTDFEALCQKMNDAGIDGVMLNAPTPDDYRRVIPVAHAHGITVYAWLWTMNLEHDRAKVLAEHPDWFSVNRLGRSLADTTAYVDYYKFLCPALPEVREYLNDKIRAYCEVEGLDGIAIDYHRFVDVVLPTTLWPRYGIVQDQEYPEWDFGYHPEMIRLFQQQYGYDPREQEDPSQDVQWRQFRCDQISEVANLFAETVHSYGKVMAASPFPTPKMASRMVRQDWGRWDLDIVFPMVYHSFYTLDPSFAYDCTAENYYDKKPGTALYCGLMYSDDITDCMDEAFRAGAQGISIFTVMSLRTPEQTARFRAYTDSVRNVVAANGGHLPVVPAPGRADINPFHHHGVMVQIEKRMQYLIAGFDWNQRRRRGEPAIQVPPLAPLSLGEYRLVGGKDITRVYEVTDWASGTTFLVTFYLYGDVISGWDVAKKVAE